MRELVVVVAIVDENLIHDNLGSCPNLATNVKREHRERFLYVSDELINRAALDAVVLCVCLLHLWRERVCNLL